MKKNVAGQVIGFQLISKTDGSAVTSGTTTVSITGDGGTYTTGSVGSGAATHKGGGYWEYAPAQAETNYDHVAFTAVNSSAVNATVQVFTSFPQTGDNYARIGAPAGASVSADVAAIKAVLPASLVSGRIDASVGAMASGVLTASAIASDAITAAKIADGAIDAATFAAGAIDASAIATDALGALELAAGAASEIASAVRTELTTELGRIDASISSRSTYAGADTSGTTTLLSRLTSTRAGNLDNLDAAVSSRLATSGYTAPLDAAGTRSAVGLASANLDTQLSTISSYIDTEVAAIKTVTDKVDQTLEIDASGPWRFTADALSRAPTGTGSGGGLTQADVRAAIGMSSANMDTQLAGIQGDTNDIQTRLPAALVSGRMDSSVGAMATDVLDANALKADAVTEIQSGLSTLTAAGVRSAVGLASANLDTQLDALPTTSEVKAQADQALADVGVTTTVTGRIDAAISTRLQTSSYTAPDNATISAIAGYVDTEVSAIKAVTDKVDAMLEADASGPYRWTSDALSKWDQNYVEGTTTYRASAQYWNAAAAGKIVVSGMTYNLRNIDDTLNRIVGVTDGTGQRTSMTLNPT